MSEIFNFIFSHPLLVLCFILYVFVFDLIYRTCFGGEDDE